MAGLARSKLEIRTVHQCDHKNVYYIIPVFRLPIHANLTSDETLLGYFVMLTICMMYM